MPQKSQLPKVSRWLTKLQAIGFGCLLLLCIEGGFRLLGFGDNTLGNDPLVGFSTLEPLFALDPNTENYQTRRERYPYFIQERFPQKKGKDSFRIFAFGGSTVQGRPYSIQTAFPKWLQINLETAFPDKNFEVINCGGISYASYRLVPIIEECLDYEPDLFILCTGQNEFLEARTYGSIKRLAKPLGSSVKVISKLATYEAMDGLYRRIKGTELREDSEKKPTMKREVDALLDYRRGLEAYHRDPKWHWGVVTHFQENIRRIDSISQKAGVPLVILNPPVNLKDTPPFKSEHHSNLSDSQKEAYHEWIKQANEHYESDPQKAAQYLKWAIDLDPEYALAHYSLGHCYLALRQFVRAEKSFQTALIEDVCPLRLQPNMRSFVNDFCDKNHIPHIDLQVLLKEHTSEAVIGGEILVDHVHPSIRGHQIIAEATAELLFETLLIDQKSKDWETNRAEAYKAHFETLEPLYYTHGKLRLENLLLWTKGETEGPAIEMHKPINSQ
ncbi:MAG: tetratricopeptide repeat protein [Verrucomicrobia bacterium]|nr:tetratricopeptide repeat protein [Verrucomicrobiota bacterium]MDA1069127.1 tetratricopeptide repeat protein [Verrucomicrobiota bacterium]